MPRPTQLHNRTPLLLMLQPMWPNRKTFRLLVRTRLMLPQSMQLLRKMPSMLKMQRMQLQRTSHLSAIAKWMAIATMATAAPWTPAARTHSVNTWQQAEFATTATSAPAATPAATAPARPARRPHATMVKFAPTTAVTRQVVANTPTIQQFAMTAVCAQWTMPAPGANAPRARPKSATTMRFARTTAATPQKAVSMSTIRARAPMTMRARLAMYALPVHASPVQPKIAMTNNFVPLTAVTQAAIAAIWPTTSAATTVQNAPWSIPALTKPAWAAARWIATTNWLVQSTVATPKPVARTT